MTTDTSIVVRTNEPAAVATTNRQEDRPMQGPEDRREASFPARHVFASERRRYPHEHGGRVSPALVCDAAGQPGPLRTGDRRVRGAVSRTTRHHHDDAVRIRTGEGPRVVPPALPPLPSSAPQLQASAEPSAAAKSLYACITGRRLLQHAVARVGGDRPRPLHMSQGELGERLVDAFAAHPVLGARPAAVRRDTRVRPRRHFAAVG